MAVASLERETLLPRVLSKGALAAPAPCEKFPRDDSDDPPIALMGDTLDSSAIVAAKELTTGEDIGDDTFEGIAPNSMASLVAIEIISESFKAFSMP